jgi:hypothetical protein
VTLPWSFNWYGQPENVITIGTNGLLTFGEPQYMCVAIAQLLTFVGSEEVQL